MRTLSGNIEERDLANPLLSTWLYGRFAVAALKRRGFLSLRRVRDLECAFECQHQQRTSR